MKKKIFVIIGLIALVTVVIGLYMYQKPVQSLRGTEPYKTFTAQEIFSEFEENELEASKTYNGKVLQVSGELSDILINSDSSTTLVLASNHPIFGVKCRMDPGEENSKVPEIGSKLNILGLCTGMNSDVELNQCILK